MARIIKDNKDVIQSYVFTMAKYDFSVYEKRIMYRLVELAQCELKGLKMKDNLYKISPTITGREIQMPVSAILKDETDKNYDIAKRAFKSLATKGVEYEDEKIWSFTNIITCPKIKKGEGIAIFNVFDEIWKCILNFTKGYKKYELATAMSFKSVYSMRFYELLSGQTTPLSLSVEDILERFKLKGQYKRISNFEEKILKVAQRELDESSPYSFTFERITIPSRGRQGYKITGYTFIPKFIHKNRAPELEKKELQAKIGNITGQFGMLDKGVNDYLLYNIGFTKDEINTNKDLFLMAQKQLSDFIEILSYLNGKSREKTNPKGWIINAIKGKMADLKKE